MVNRTAYSYTYLMHLHNKIYKISTIVIIITVCIIIIDSFAELSLVITILYPIKIIVFIIRGRNYHDLIIMSCD